MIQKVLNFTLDTYSNSIINHGQKQIKYEMGMQRPSYFRSPHWPKLLMFHRVNNTRAEKYQITKALTLAAKLNPVSVRLNMSTRRPGVAVIICPLYTMQHWLLYDDLQCTAEQFKNGESELAIKQGKVKWHSLQPKRLTF